MTTTTLNAELDTMDDETTTTCDGCYAEMTSDAYDATEGLCPACQGLHTTCGECGEKVLKSDMHASRKGLCESCGDEAIETEHAEALDAAGDDLDTLVDEIKGLEDLTILRKAVAALKRLTK